MDIWTFSLFRQEIHSRKGSCWPISIDPYTSHQRHSLPYKKITKFNEENKGNFTKSTYDNYAKAPTRFIIQI